MYLARWNLSARYQVPKVIAEHRSHVLMSQSLQSRSECLNNTARAVCVDVHLSELSQAGCHRAACLRTPVLNDAGQVADGSATHSSCFVRCPLDEHSNADLTPCSWRTTLSRHCSNDAC